MTVPNVHIVVPCYNEATRLDGEQMLALADARPDLGVIFVDDGSTDDTAARLGALAAARPERITVLTLAKNSGKGEAVRQGLLGALSRPGELVGYLDADLSAPVEEILRLVRVAESRGAAVVLGARVGLLGMNIERKPARHYLGRVFASAASLLLDLPVYDTQCGAKVLRRSPSLAAALAEPFVSRWAFDVELIGRLLVGAPGVPPTPREAFLEVPLASWREVSGSKLRPSAMVGTLRDLAVIGGDLARRRRKTR